MGTYSVDASVVIWAIRHCMDRNDYVAWDGVRLARAYTPQLDRGYLKVLQSDVDHWLHTHEGAEPILHDEWEDILSTINTTLLAKAS